MKHPLNALPSLSLVLGFIAVKNFEEEDQIDILLRLGYGILEISTIVGCGYRHVKARLDK